MLGERFPQPNLPAKIRPIGPAGHVLSGDEYPKVDGAREAADVGDGSPSEETDVAPGTTMASTDLTSHEQVAARPLSFDDTRQECAPAPVLPPAASPVPQRF